MPAEKKIYTGYTGLLEGREKSHNSSFYFLREHKGDKGVHFLTVIGSQGFVKSVVLYILHNLLTYWLLGLRTLNTSVKKGGEGRY